MKFNVRSCLVVTGYVDSEIEVDTVDDLREAVEDLLANGGDDEPVEIDWDSSRDYELVRVTLADSGHVVELPAAPIEEEEGSPTYAQLRQALADVLPAAEWELTSLEDHQEDEQVEQEAIDLRAKIDRARALLEKSS